MSPPNFRLVSLALAALLSLPASAAPGLLSKFVSTPAAVAPAKASGGLTARSDFSDAWWVPSESGWGINILQQGSSLVLMFYIFDDSNQPVWYRAVTRQTSTGSYEGVIYRDAGTSYREVNFGPVQYPSVAVGQLRFQPTTLYDGVLTYTLGDTTASKTMTRIAFDGQDYSGVHASSVTAQISSCGDKAGSLSGNLQTELIVSGSSASMVLSSGAATCVISGPFRQRGRLGQIIDGSYSCSDGGEGTARVDGWDNTGGAFTAIVSTTSGACSEWGRIAGVRQD